MSTGAIGLLLIVLITAGSVLFVIFSMVRVVRDEHTPDAASGSSSASPSR